MRRRRAILASLSWILVSLFPGDSRAQPAPLPDIYTQIQAAFDYITYSSWTEENPNSVGWNWFQPTDDIHGAINDIRVPVNGPPNHHAWVQPAIEATAAIGMMQGLAFLNDNGIDISTYDAVIDKLFLVWELAHQQGQNRDPDSADYGAFMNTVDYNAQGSEATNNPLWKTDVTGLMLTANWKYWEYNVKLDQLQQAGDWLDQAWSIQKIAADYLVRMHDTTPAGSIHLLPGNSTPQQYDAWILSSPPMRCPACGQHRYGRSRSALRTRTTIGWRTTWWWACKP